MTGEKAILMPILQGMLRLRYFEENLYQMYLAKKIPGMSPHLSVGQGLLRSACARPCRSRTSC